MVSPQSYNRKVGLALFCPITSNVKGYPFETVLPDGLPVSGAVLCDQVKSLDWRARTATKICAAPREVVSEMTSKLLALVDPEVA